MTNGTYSVRFKSSLGDYGGGVVVVDNGKINGRDITYSYQGKYELKGGLVVSEIKVSHYQGPLNSVFGPLKVFGLNLTGTATDTSFALSGHIEGQPQLAIAILGERHADLSA